MKGICCFCFYKHHTNFEMKKNSFVFIGQVVPQELLNENFEELNKTVDIAGNTFYTALLEGLAEHGCSVSAVSRIKTKIQKGKKNYHGVDYQFMPYIKQNKIRFLSLAFGGFAQIVKFKARERKKSTNGYAVFNILRISSSIGAILACKLLRIPSIGVVTDVPGYRIKQNKNSMIGILSDQMGKILLNRFDMYVLLSEAMQDVLRLDKKPYTIIEGIYDSSKIAMACHNESKISDNKFKIVYAGSLHYQYGIMNLVEAVQRLSYLDMELNIYGSGEAAKEISKIAQKDKRIIFGGLIPRNQLLVCEKEASLLVNPRPVEDEYVKYSFPSKNMEYMASGTPVLLTNIPSLPSAYKRYVILAETNEVSVLSDKIEEVYKNQEKYTELGLCAQKYINDQKNKKKQSLKVIEMVENGK